MGLWKLYKINCLFLYGKDFCIISLNFINRIKHLSYLKNLGRKFVVLLVKEFQAAGNVANKKREIEKSILNEAS